MRVVERTNSRIMVSLSIKHWDRLMELEKAYKTAHTILNARRQCESMPAMSVSEAYNMIDSL